MQFLLILFLTIKAWAVPLNCEININLSPVLKTNLESKLNEKVVAGHWDATEIFITEKPNHYFIVEGFLANYDARIYAEGSLREAGDHLTASIWGRENQTEIICLLKAP